MPHQHIAANNDTRLAARMRRHPLASFFIMAYGISWMLWVPLLMLSQDGLGLLPLRVPAVPLVIVGGFGPTLTALIMTGMLEGGPGVRLLLRRCIQWRAGLLWYLLAIFLVPISFLAVSVWLGAIPFATLAAKWPLLLTFYPVDLIAQVIVAGGLGEEPGWRGFALPRMQPRFGSLGTAVLLGVLHACWHIPLFFVRGLSQANFNFALYLLMGIGISVLLTWVYNNTGGSLLLMMLLHEAEDTTSSLSLRMVPAYLDRTPAYAVLYTIIALVILLATRGSLSYKSAGARPEPDATARA